MTYEVILFDSDGVLVRPTDRAAVEEGVRTTLAAFEISDPHPDHVAAFSSGRSIEVLESIAREWELDLADVWAHRDATVSQVQCDLVSSRVKCLYDDVRDVLERLAAHHRLGVVSNNQEATVSFVLEHEGIREYFDVVYGRPETLEGFRHIKPDPYLLEQALQRFDDVDALYVGDSETDIEAARRADLDVVYLRREHNEDPELEPTYLIHSLSELPPIVES